MLKKIKNFDDKIYIFGAGEFSQVVQCYAPNFFDKIDSILVSNKKGARSFSKPIKLINDIKLNSGYIFICVNEKILTSVIDKLVKIGWSKYKLKKISN